MRAEGLYGIVSRLVHGGHARAIGLFWEAVNVRLEGDWADGRVEVEEAVLFYSQPIRQILRIRQCSTQPHNPALRLQLRSNKPHP